MKSRHSPSNTSAQVKNRITEFIGTCVEWTRSGQSQVAVTQPPIYLPPGIRSTPHGDHLLTEDGRHRRPSPNLHAWPHAGVASARYPLMVAIMEGEADFRIGLTETMRQLSPELRADYQVQVLQVPRASLLFIPPGVPFSDGEHMPHWERSNIEDASSTILWCYFLSHGALLQFCRTRGSQHTYSGSMFLLDSSLLSMTEILMENMKRNGGRLDGVDHAVLLALLLSMERDCHSHHDMLSAWPSDAEMDDRGRGVFSDDQALERARQYIESHLHLNDLMKVTHIAAHAFVSTSHLNKLFRARLNTSVMDYVAQQRIELAKKLLLETTLSINDVSRVVGYSRPNYFARVFYRVTGEQPSRSRQSNSTRRGHPAGTPSTTIETASGQRRE